MKTRRPSLLFILGALSAIGPFSIDMYLPGFPQIAKSLNTDLVRVGYSLTSYFIGISVGQLIYGPLTDRFGRKKPLLFGLTFYILASLGCVFALDIYTLVGLRVLQALGGCVGMIIGRAIVRDLFDPSQTAKIFSLLMLMIGVAPVIAPTVGGMVAASLGWQALFVILTLFGIFLWIVVYFFLPESKGPDTSVSLKLQKIFARYVSLFKNQDFLPFALASAALSSGLYAYIAGSPFIYMEIFGFNEREYGWIYAVNALGMISGSQLNHLLLKKWSSVKVSLILAYLQVLCGGFLVLFTSSLFSFNPVIFKISFFILVFLFLTTHGILSPNTSALAINPMGAVAGTASSLMGFIQMVFGSLATAIVSFFHSASAMPMAQVMIGFALLGTLFLWFGVKKSPQRDQNF